MKGPALAAVMERRILVNYRVDPDLLGSYLPAPFRPALVGGHGVAGICLIRLGRIRPAGLPAAGLRSENAAHRAAVCWDGPDGPVAGVYVPRRDTSSWLAALAGGRLFPGYLHLARFRAHEDAEGYRIHVASRDGTVHIEVEAHLAGELPPGSIFTSLEAASGFFRRAPAGYAATPAVGVFDGVELETAGWTLRPLRLDKIASSFFDDRRRFPAGTAVPDSAFLMSGLSTIWHPQPRLRAIAATGLAGCDVTNATGAVGDPAVRKSACPGEHALAAGAPRAGGPTGPERTGRGPAGAATRPQAFPDRLRSRLTGPHLPVIDLG
jgi:Uncharacterized conserved protein (COG2071)